MINPTFNASITLYNRYVDRSGVKTKTTWHRIVLNDCFFAREAVTDLSSNTLSMADGYICRIPEDKRFTEDYKGEENTFTLCPEDIIVEGQIDDVISDAQGSRVSDLIAKYSGRAFTVKSVSINTKLPVGKHYRAKGV